MGKAFKHIHNDGIGDFIIQQSLDGSIKLRDLIISARQAPGSEFMIAFQDEKVTEPVFMGELQNDSINMSMLDLDFVGWAGADLVLSVIGEAKVHVTIGYNINSIGEPFELWNKRRG